MDQVSKFWDRMADRYAAQPVADEEAYQHKLKVTRSHFTPDTEVLEFGCGTGSTALAHANHVKHIRAIDFSARMIEICRAKAKARGINNVSFEQADITTLKAVPSSQKVILGMSILHLLKHPQQVINKVFDLLAPGGVFISSTECMGDHMAFIKYIAPLGIAIGLLPQISVMTRVELRQKLIRAGFEIETEWQPGDLPKKAVFFVARKPE